MLCLQTSYHRCPSALHNRLVTSTPSLSPLSLIHHVRVDASWITVGTRLVARTAAVTRKTLAWPLAGPRRRHTGGRKTRRRSRRLRRSRRWRTGAVARGARRAKNEPTAPVRRRRTEVLLCFIELPTEDPPRERETLAQLRPVHGLHAHRLEFRRVRAPHDAQHDIAPDLRLLDERQ